MKKLEIGPNENRALIQALQKVAFFKDLTIAQLDLMLPYIYLYEYKAGEGVFKKGDPGDAMYIVCEGTASVRIKKGFFSFAKTVTQLRPGDLFGEMALLDKKPRSATIIVEETAKLFVMLVQDYEFVCQNNPQFGEIMRKIATTRKFESSHWK
ncbi:cyclic nucleotide-binding domain-containing protein [Elusimicrobiota bacterium]